MSKSDVNNSNSFEIVASEHAAWVGILLVCIAADDYIDPSENAAVVSLLSTREKFRGVDLVPLYKEALRVKEEVGQEEFVTACCKWIANEDKETVFALALDVILADGQLVKEEKNLIEILSTTLRIDPKMSSKIIEVIFLKNKGIIKRA